VTIIRRALTHHAHTILTNAGEEASIVVRALLVQYGSADKFAWGYDAQKGEYVGTIKAGIVDPLKVVRTALVDASGVVSLLRHVRLMLLR
jgi:chaperonin GroEL